MIVRYLFLSYESKRELYVKGGRKVLLQKILKIFIIAKNAGEKNLILPFHIFQILHLSEISANVIHPLNSHFPNEKSKKTECENK